MTRTDVMASSRPGTAGAPQSSRGSTGIGRRLSLIPAVLVIAALAVPSAALGAEGTSGYSQTPNTPSTSTTPAPSTGTSPSKETGSPTSTTPAKAAEPASSSAPTEAKKAGTLPFTGFDLRWSIGFGLLLMGAGFWIVVSQRRHRRDGR
jgi:hypothetical protein